VSKVSFLNSYLKVDLTKNQLRVGMWAVWLCQIAGRHDRSVCSAARLGLCRCLDCEAARVFSVKELTRAATGRSWEARAVETLRLRK
jgi:hypothetical protein